MLLKSENKTIEEIIALDDREIFRAYYKAIIKEDFGLCLRITENLPPEKLTALESNHILFLCKFIALQTLLLNKALLAINFYNSLLSRFLGKDYSKKLYGKQFTFTEERLKEIQFLKEKIKDLDTKTKGALELEEFSFLEEIEKDFDYWVDIGEDLIEKLKSVYSVQD